MIFPRCWQEYNYSILATCVGQETGVWPNILHRELSNSGNTKLAMVGALYSLEWQSMKVFSTKKIDQFVPSSHSKRPPTMWYPNSLQYTHLQVSLQCERFSLFCGRLGYEDGYESGYEGCSVTTAGLLPAQRSGRCHNSELLYQMNQHPAGNSINHHHNTPIWPIYT